MLNKLKIITLISAIMLISNNAWAVPIFQTYIEGAVYGAYGTQDQQTWISSANPFTLKVAGLFKAGGSGTLSLTGMTLLVSVPKGDTGTISITNATADDELPVLLTSIGTNNGNGYTNPLIAADTDILTGIGLDGYSTKGFLPTEPSPTNFNNHYPFQEGVADFLLFNLFPFENVEGIVNYNDIGEASARGEEKVYIVSFSGFDWLHFDVYGLETSAKGQGYRYSWDQNPGSHDSTAETSPEPGTMALFGIGISGLAARLIRRKKVV